MGVKLITVEVTQEDIDLQDRSDCYGCMVARALARATGEAWHVWKADARIVDEHPAPRIRFGTHVRRMIARADRSEPVEPFSFKIAARWAAKEAK